MAVIPMKVQILQAFIKNSESRLTISEIAKYCKASVQSVSYNLKQLIQTSLILQEVNDVTNKSYYYINDFFLNGDNINQAREALNPFIDFFIESFYFPDSMTEMDIEKDIIEFIHTIAWLFTHESKKVFEEKQNHLENNLKR